MIDKPSGRNQKILALLTIVISLTFSLTVAEWILRYQRQSIETSEHMEPGMILYDAHLGWKLKPYWTGKHHHLDYDVTYNINRNGFRGNDHPVQKNNDVSIVGDSFSFGLGVNDNETFAALLNNNNSGSSYFNFSVPGYSTDQQLLLINKLTNTISQHVMLVVYLGNDIFDNMRAYPLQAEHGKPYFEIQDGKLNLVNTPVPLKQKTADARKESISSIVLGEHYQKNIPLNWLSQLEISRRIGLALEKTELNDAEMASRFSDSLILFTALINEINSVIENNSGKLEVVLMPGRSYIEQPKSLSAQYQEYFRQQIISSLTKAPDIKLLDLAVHLRELHSNGAQILYHPNEGHLTASGHKQVALYLLEQSKQN